MIVISTATASISRRDWKALQSPADVYVTRGVRDQLEGHPGLSFEDKGERRVKNIKTPIRVYCVKFFKEQQRRAPLWRLMHRGRRLAQNPLALRPRAALLTGFMLAIIATLTIAALPTWRDCFTIAAARLDLGIAICEFE